MISIYFTIRLFVLHLLLLAITSLLTADQLGYIFDRPIETLSESSIRELGEVCPSNESIELDDGSIWRVSLYDWWKIRHWIGNEAISITQNTNRFSNYPYRMVNRRTGASIEVVLSAGPIQFGTKTNYVDSYDLTRAALCLTNGSIWKIHPKSLAIAQMWNRSLPIALIIADNSQSDQYADEDWDHILIDVAKPNQFLYVHKIF